MAAAQAGWIAASGLRRKAVPSCTALAPRVSAAAMPRPSMMPPAATTGDAHRVPPPAGSRDKESRPGSLGGGILEGAAMAARLGALRHHGIGAGGLGGAGLGDGGGVADPGDAARLQPRRELGREDAHDG